MTVPHPWVMTWFDGRELPSSLLPTALWILGKKESKHLSTHLPVYLDSPHPNWRAAWICIPLNYVNNNEDIGLNKWPWKPTDLGFEF